MRAALPSDHDAIWSILEPIVRAGETYAQPRDRSRESMLAYWFQPDHDVFVTDDLLGTYFVCANHAGGGAHVANCVRAQLRLSRDAVQLRRR